MHKDIFICHASEDKPAVVRPLVVAFEQEGISCWLDEAEIAWGDSITAKVNEGLKTSNYVLVILSRAFLSKNWPKRELWAVLNIEARTGDVKILPILVGSDSEIQGFLDEFPLLNDKHYLVWDGSPLPVVRNFIALANGSSHPPPERDDLLICGQCRTPFERGVHVCLGCKGAIIYGLTPQERLEKRQIGIMGTATLLLMFFFAAPALVRSWLNLPVPDMWGLSILPCLGFTGTASIVAGFALEWYATKKRRDLVRTFR